MYQNMLRAEYLKNKKDRRYNQHVRPFYGNYGAVYDDREEENGAARFRGVAFVFFGIPLYLLKA